MILLFSIDEQCCSQSATERSALNWWWWRWWTRDAGFHGTMVGRGVRRHESCGRRREDSALTWLDWMMLMVLEFEHFQGVVVKRSNPGQLHRASPVEDPAGEGSGRAGTGAGEHWQCWKQNIRELTYFGMLVMRREKEEERKINGERNTYLRCGTVAASKRSVLLVPTFHLPITHFFSR